MMILRCALLLAAAVTLSNCFMLPNSVAPSPVASTATPNVIAAAPAAQAAWDGLGNAPDDENDAPSTPTTKKPARRKADADISAQSKGNVSWQEQQALDNADDARLKQKLIICKNCSGTQ